MVDDKCHTLSEKRAYDTHLVACAEGYGCESVVGDVLELEVTRIVEEAYVDTSGVGRIMVYNLQVPFAELGLPDYVFHDGAVFDFGDTDYGGAHRCGLGGELRNGICEVVDFLPVFAAVPLALSAGSEFEVATFGIVGDCIEEVLPVIESHAGDLDFASGVLRACYRWHNECKCEQCSGECAFQVHFEFLWCFSVFPLQM